MRYIAVLLNLGTFFCDEEDKIAYPARFHKQMSEQFERGIQRQPSTSDPTGQVSVQVSAKTQNISVTHATCQYSSLRLLFASSPATASLRRRPPGYRPVRCYCAWSFLRRPMKPTTSYPWTSSAVRRRRRCRASCGLHAPPAPRPCTGAGRSPCSRPETPAWCIAARRRWASRLGCT